MFVSKLVKKNRLFTIAIILIALLFSSCEEEQKVQIGTEDSAMTVSVVDVKKDKFVEDLNSFGSVTFNLKNNITCQQPGVLTKLYVKDGDKVYKDQVLAELTNIQLEFQKEQFQNAVETAKANLAIKQNLLDDAILQVESKLMALDKADLALNQKQLELELEQENLVNSQELNEIGGVTDSALKQQELKVKAIKAELLMMRKEKEISALGLRDKDLIRAGYKVPDDKEKRLELIMDFNTRSVRTQIEACEVEVKNAENSLNAVNKLIETLTIRAPLTGIIGGKQFEQGEYIAENGQLLSVMDTSSVYAVIYIQEKDMVNYSLGSEIIVEVPSLNKVIKTEISEISPVADVQSGNFSIKAKLPNKDNLIKPGMFITCTIKNNNIQKLCKIPESALVAKTDNTGIVFCIKNNYVFQQKVDIKSIKDGFVWINDGLFEHDKIVDSPSPFLREGQSVTW